MVAHPMVLPVHHLAFNGARKIGSFKKIPVDVGGYFDFIWFWEMICVEDVSLVFMS